MIRCILYLTLISYYSSFIFATPLITHKIRQKRLPLLSWPYILDLSKYREKFLSLPVVEFYNLNTRESFKTKLYNQYGKIPQKVLQRFMWLLRDHRHNKIHPIYPRILKLVYKSAYYFKAKKVVIISGYRYGKKWRWYRGRKRIASRHHWGKAIDFYIPEVSTKRLAIYARTFGKVGVGYYPKVNFIHLDIRDSSYFWLNRSGHGKRGWDIPLERYWAEEIDKNLNSEYDLPWVKVDKRFLLMSSNIKVDKKLIAYKKKRWLRRKKKRKIKRTFTIKTRR